MGPPPSFDPNDAEIANWVIAFNWDTTGRGVTVDIARGGL
jgi:hypothetical protein